MGVTHIRMKYLMALLGFIIFTMNSATTQTLGQSFNCSNVTSMSQEDNKTSNCSTVFTLEVPTHAFKLWAYVIIALAILVLLSMLFVATVKACGSGKKKKRTHEFQTTVVPTSQGSRQSIGSVYRVTSHEEHIELTDAGYMHYDTLASLRVEEDDIIPIHTYEELPRHSPTDLDVPSVEGTTEVGAEAGRDKFKAYGDIDNAPEERARGRVDPTGGTAPVGTGSEAASRTNNTREQNDGYEEGEDLSERKTARDKHQPLVRQFTFEDGTIMSDYPISVDPEIHSDVGEVGEGTPATIYSSQFLSLAVRNADEESSTDKGRSNSLVELVIVPELSVPIVMIEDTERQLLLEGKEGHLYYTLEPPPRLAAEFQSFQRDYNMRRSFNVRSASSINPESNITTQTSSLMSQLEHIATSDTATFANDSQYPSTLDQQSPTPNMALLDPLYDIPFNVDTLKVHSPTSDSSSCLFDDPNYMRGLLSSGQTASPEHEDNHHTDESETTESSTATEEEADDVQPDKEAVEPARHLDATPKEIRSSIDPLTLLDLQSEELAELDPDVAACFVSEEELEDEMQDLVMVTDV